LSDVDDLEEGYTYGEEFVSFGQMLRTLRKNKPDDEYSDPGTLLLIGELRDWVKDTT
jgi:hypothetical protein